MQRLRIFTIVFCAFGGLVGAKASACTDTPSPYMVENGLTCDTWGYIYENRCNADVDANPSRASWLQNKWCQRSCWVNGNGYDGDDCATAAPSCTDIPHPFMLQEGKTCDTWDWMYTNRCNADLAINPGRAEWVQNKWCQRSCWSNGKGYDGDDCSKDIVRPSTTPLVTTTLPLPVTTTETAQVTATTTAQATAMTTIMLVTTHVPTTTVTTTATTTVTDQATVTMISSPTSTMTTAVSATSGEQVANPIPVTTARIRIRGATVTTTTTTTTLSLPRCPGGQFRNEGGECEACAEGWVPTDIGNNCKEKETLGLNDVEWAAVGGAAAVATILVGACATMCKKTSWCSTREDDAVALNSSGNLDGQAPPAQPSWLQGQSATNNFNGVCVVQASDVSVTEPDIELDLR